MNSDKRVISGLEKWRFRIIYILLFLVFTVYVIRLFSLQIVEGADYLELAEENRIRNVSVQTQRGSIIDRNGYVLAQNAAAYNIAITPAYLPADEGTSEEIFRKLSPLLDIPVTNGVVTDESARFFTPCQTDFGIKEIVFIGDTNAPFSPVNIKCNVS